MGCPGRGPWRCVPVVPGRGPRLPPVGMGGREGAGRVAGAAAAGRTAPGCLPSWPGRCGAGLAGPDGAVGRAGATGAVGRAGGPVRTGVGPGVDGAGAGAGFVAAGGVVAAGAVAGEVETGRVAAGGAAGAAAGT